MSDEIVERFERIVSAALFSAAMVEDADVEAVRAALATAEAARPDEREAFEAWCATNGHGTLDDMMMPMDRALKNLLWSAWQARAATSRDAQDDAYVCGRNDERAAITAQPAATHDAAEAGQAPHARVQPPTEGAQRP